MVALAVYSTEPTEGQEGTFWGGPAAPLILIGGTEFTFGGEKGTSIWMGGDEHLPFAPLHCGSMQCYHRRASTQMILGGEQVPTTHTYSVLF